MNETSRLLGFGLISIATLVIVGLQYGPGPTLSALLGLCAVGYTLMPTIRHGVHE